MADTHPLPETIGESSVVRRSRAAGTVRLAGSAVLVDWSAGRAHALNPTGTLIWECLDGSGDLTSLIDDLAEGFEADRAVVARDVVDLVRDLARLGLLDGSDPEAYAWPEELLPDEGDCPPDGLDVTPVTDDRYLGVPPNG